MRFSIGTVLLLSAFATGCTVGTTSTNGPSGSSGSSGEQVTPPAGEGEGTTTPAPTGNVPAGSVPEDLLGKWFSGGEVWDFKTDGTGSHYMSTKGGTCPSEDLDSGTVVGSGNELTIYWASGIHKSCGGTVPYETKTAHYSYVVEDHTDVGLVLILTDLDCDPSARSCNSSFDKE